MTVYLRFVHDVHEQEIRAAFAHAPKEVQEVVMNTAERLMKKGEERGKRLRDRETVVNALAEGLDEDAVARILRISIEDVRRLAEEATQQASSD